MIAEEIHTVTLVGQVEELIAFARLKKW